jgi:Na+/proline symporter
MPAVLGVCFPSRRLLTRAGVLAGMGAGLATLYLTLVVAPHPLGMHGGIWSVAVNFLVAYGTSAFTRPPSPETVRRIHGEVDAFVYGKAAPAEASASAGD